MSICQENRSEIVAKEIPVLQINLQFCEYLILQSPF